MNKPHIVKIKESRWWCCDGSVGGTPAKAYRAWKTLHGGPKPTTKVCPECGSSHIALFSSFHKRLCTECYTWLTWELEPGQEPLIGPARRVRKGI